MQHSDWAHVLDGEGAPSLGVFQPRAIGDTPLSCSLWLEVAREGTSASCPCALSEQFIETRYTRYRTWNILS